MIPLPGFVVDAATGPLKQYISVIAEQVLYAAGYPIARSGVTLTVGPYQLLVADACSGLHSMFSLSAMGLLYLYLMQHTSTARNLIIMAAILPIAFVANIVRVMVLILVTYHMGDEAGQGFLHGFAGIMLFIIGLLFLFALDWRARLHLPRPAARPGAGLITGFWRQDMKLISFKHLVIGLCMFAAAGMALALKPTVKVADSGPENRSGSADSQKHSATGKSTKPSCR